MEQGAEQQASSESAHSIPAKLNRLRQPLEDYVLPELSAQAMAALRSANQDLRSLLDSASGQSWRPAMGPVLPPEIIEYAADGTAMQAMLQAQTSMLKQLRSADSPCQMHSFPTISPASTGEVHWSPGWPSRYCAVLMSVVQEQRKRMTAPPADFEPAFLLELSTWLTLPGFKPGWGWSSQDQDTWQHAWCPGRSSCKPVFACFASEQALEIAHMTHGQLHTRRLPHCYKP